MCMSVRLLALLDKEVKFVAWLQDSFSWLSYSILCESASSAEEAKLSAFGDKKGVETGTKANLLDKRFSNESKSDATVIIAFVLVGALFI